MWIDTGKGSYSRWIEYVNRDFEARLNWCVTPKYEDASHRPDIEIVSGLEITVASGDTVVIEAIVSSSGRGTGGMTQWWQYEEAGTYGGYVDLHPSFNSREPNARIR